jgi:hypothetical protein
MISLRKKKVEQQKAATAGKKNDTTTMDGRASVRDRLLVKGNHFNIFYVLYSNVMYAVNDKVLLPENGLHYT